MLAAGQHPVWQEVEAVEELLLGAQLGVITLIQLGEQHWVLLWAH